MKVLRDTFPYIRGVTKFIDSELCVNKSVSCRLSRFVSICMCVHLRSCYFKRSDDIANNTYNFKLYFINKHILDILFSDVSRGAKAQRYDCKRDRLWVRFPLGVMKYLIFLFDRSDKEAFLR